MNLLVVLGRIIEQPVLNVTTNGLNYCDLLIEPIDNEDKTGEVFKVRLWKQSADYLKDNGKKGDSIIIKGRLKPNNYAKENGEIFYKADIVADKVLLIK